jgi:hypothetical protein
MACRYGARDADFMGQQRPPAERLAETKDLRSNAGGWTLVMWIVAAFLGALIGTYYLLERVLVGA